MHCTAELLDKRSPYKAPGADSEEKRGPVSDIDIAVADSLKVLVAKGQERAHALQQTASLLNQFAARASRCLGG
jgi:hypothetical protein